MPDFDDGDQVPQLRRTFEPYGEAALILVESLIHGLLARGVLSIAEVQDIVDIAVTSQTEVDKERQGNLLPSTATIFLTEIAASLRIDARGDPDVILP